LYKSFTSNYDDSGVTLSVGASDIGSPRTLRFLFHLWSGVTVDATTGNLVFSTGFSDSAPDDSVWAYRVEGPAPTTHADWQAATDGSKALSKELRRAGFRFVGPTTAYAAMQACGVVNDHLATCPARAGVEEARREIPFSAVRRNR
jgi:hypothetical protein